MEIFKNNRQFMKSNFGDPEIEEVQSDQEKYLPQPPLQKAHDYNAKVIDLPKNHSDVLSKPDIYACLKDRRSTRKYSETPLSIGELSFLLWATQGVDRKTDNNYATFRPVASAGARHPFETYLVINRVEGIEPGMYRYLPLSHQLVYLFDVENAEEKVITATLGQKFAGQASVVFIWTCVPYRGEWRYHLTAHKAMLLDAGHVCQNLYVACEAVDCGTCAIAAYDQGLADGLIGVDGEDEFTVYMAPVGKK